MLVGVTNCEHERARLLLKVLAVSDIVIYGIHSERMHRDSFRFLGTASRTYSNFFKTTLEAVGQQERTSNMLSMFGPSLIVFHVTKHTKPLTNSMYHFVFRMIIILR